MQVSDPPRLSAVTADRMASVAVQDHCKCLIVRVKGAPLVPRLHVEPQDENAAGWIRLTGLIEHVAASQGTTFEPAALIPREEWMGVTTLPAALSSLGAVKELQLYGSYLRRLPPEIGRLESLELLDVYTSYSLHWLPYEVMRCTKLKRTRMSTRALYGNRKTRLPFPPLARPIDTIRSTTCSVCNRALEGRIPHLYWTTQRVGTDYAPLLIQACSIECVEAVPSAPPGYHPRPHKGGGEVGMPLS